MILVGEYGRPTGLVGHFRHRLHPAEIILCYNLL